jgi:uncharacterized protein (TIGR04141 family)
MPRPRRRDLTFYLVKPEVTAFDEVLPPGPGVQLFDTIDVGLPYMGRLVVKAPSSSVPWWAGWLRTSFVSIGELRNASNQAALLLTSPSGRIFVVTFGYGRNLMALDAFQRDFGLRVALNVIEPDSLKSVDARSFEQLTVSTRSQTSRAAPLDSFRVSRAEDIMKGVTGTPRNADFAKKVTGADAVKLLFVPDLPTLDQKCEELLAAYRADVYLERFAFVDNLRTVRDPERVESLNDRVIASLQTGELGTMHLAPPEVTDIENVESFRYDDDGDIREELDLGEYCHLLSTTDQEVSLQHLKQAKVGVGYRGNEAVHWLWSVFDCLVAEVRDGDLLYILSGGAWYQVNQAFATQVAEAVATRRAPEGALPAQKVGETEPAYNERAAGLMGFHLLDGCLARPNGATSAIECCDLLSSDRLMVHIKRRSRSSTLSHLFAQGLVAAEVFLRDASFRAALSVRLEELDQPLAAAQIPVERPRADQWTVMFAILSDSPAAPPADLPFFSQLNFKLAAERLEDLSYRVVISLVPSVDD